MCLVNVRFGFFVTRRASAPHGRCVHYGRRVRDGYVSRRSAGIGRQDRAFIYVTRLLRLRSACNEAKRQFQRDRSDTKMHSPIL